MSSSKKGHPTDRSPQRLGGKIGPRVAALTSRAMSDHLKRTAHTRAKIGTEAALGVFRTMTQEKLNHVTPLLELWLNQDGTPAELERMLDFIAHGSGELSEMFTALSGAQVVGTAITSAIANYLAPTNQGLILSSPNAILDPVTMAQAQVKGIAEGWDYAREAAKGGIDNSRFAILNELGKREPDFAALIQLWRRGEVGEEEVLAMMARYGFVGDWGNRLLQLKREPIAPADGALMVLRGIISEEEGRAIGHAAGLLSGDFDKLVLATGEPPGLMQLLEAFRRGFIDDARLQRGIKQSRVRNEWIDVVERLRFEPASTSDALRGVVQGHLSDSEGKQIAEWNGLRSEDWDWLVQTEGNPPGLMEVASLWNRGVLGEAEFDQAARESHLKNKYIPAMRELRHKLPAERLVVTLVQHGAMDAPTALGFLEKEGYQPEVAKAIVEGGINQQAAHDKQLARADVLELYHDHAITLEKARELLGHLGYHTANADLILSLVDLKREHGLQKAAADSVHTAYTARHIEENEASAALDKIGIPPAQRDYMLALWAIERSAHHRTLSEAQVIKANTLGLIGDTDAEARLIALGYHLDDARILLDSEKGRSRNAP